MKPIVHAKNSVKRYKGKVEDYLPIHEFMDSSKACVAGNHHRTLTHNSWFIKMVIPRVFGNEMKNSDGRMFRPEDVAEQHVLEDFGNKFIPTPQDYLENLEVQSWMSNVGYPSSFKAIIKRRKNAGTSERGIQES